MPSQFADSVTLVCRGQGQRPRTLTVGMVSKLTGFPVTELLKMEPPDRIMLNQRLMQRLQQRQQVAHQQVAHQQMAHQQMAWHGQHQPAAARDDVC